MAFWVVPPVANLVEPVIAPEIYVDGIGAIEFNNGSVRVYLTAEQLQVDGDVAQHVVGAKIIGLVSNLPMIIGQLAMCMIARRDEPAKPPPNRPHLVR